MNLRYSPKLFDVNFKLTESQLVELVKVANLTPTSMGIQLTRLILIESDEAKEILSNYSYNQPQIKSCSVLAILCTKLQDHIHNVEDYLDEVKSKRDLDNLSIEKVANSINMFYSTKTKQGIKDWARNQTYITLGNLVSHCSKSDIDSCPMEGFQMHLYKDYLDKKLGDGFENYEPTVLLALGKADSKDKNKPKVRISNDRYNLLGKITRTL